MPNTIAQLDLCALADAIAAGDITSVATSTVALERLDTVGRKLNAVVRLDPDRALQAAEAADKLRATGAALPPLHGVPLAHKDLFCREGDLSAGGSKIRAGFRAEVTATVIERLDAAGALDLGRLQLAEFAMSPTGYNEYNGHALNPWNPAHVPGGSSSGSGVAVAARLVAGSLGTDTGGSLRHPGAMCGLVGLKPTWGLVPTDGVMPLAASLDCTGPLTRTARDAARLLSVIAGGDYESALTGSVKDLIVAVPSGYYRELLDPVIAVRLENALAALRNLGATTIETAPPVMAIVNALMHVLMSVEAATIHRRWLIERRSGSCADRARLVLSGDALCRGPVAARADHATMDRRLHRVRRPGIAAGDLDPGADHRRHHRRRSRRCRPRHRPAHPLHPRHQLSWSSRCLGAVWLRRGRPAGRIPARRSSLQ